MYKVGLHVGSLATDTHEQTRRPLKADSETVVHTMNNDARNYLQNKVNLRSNTRHEHATNRGTQQKATHNRNNPER